jgi:hypothetical protein
MIQIIIIQSKPNSKKVQSRINQFMSYQASAVSELRVNKIAMEIKLISI